MDITASNRGRGVITIYSYTDDMLSIIDKFLELHPDFGFIIQMKNLYGIDDNYDEILDHALDTGGAAGADIYCVPADLVTRYTQGEMSGYAMPYKELGIDVDAGITKAGIFRYIVDIGTRIHDDAVVGLGFESTTGAYIYRRSIAKKIWGTDDPAVIRTKIGPGWDKFFAAAADLKDKGFAIVSGGGDIWYAVEKSNGKGWIQDGKLCIDPKHEVYLDYFKQLIDKGYSNDTTYYYPEWRGDMAGLGPRPVFGFFGPATTVNYVIAANCGAELDAGRKLIKAGGTYGDWAVCEPPAGFFSGGMWLLANKNLSTDRAKKEAIAGMIEWMTLDCTENSLQYYWANGKLDIRSGVKNTVASCAVMEISDGTADILGGQDMFDVFILAGRDIRGWSETQYDMFIGTLWQMQASEFAHGRCTRGEVIAVFKRKVKERLGIEA